MKDAELSMEDYKPGDKHIPFRILDGKYTGAQLEGVRYEQLMPWVKPEGDAFRVIVGDFVTTSDGTGIVHIAPTFGADDDRAARQAGVSPLLMIDKDGKRQPMVDRNGRFFRIEDLHPDFVAKSVNVEKYSEFAGRYVKNAYDERLTDEDATLDVDLSVMLKKEDRAFKVGKHIHSYPHCWRTDKPVLYYPLDSWFIRTTALRERMIELNNTINWKPASTGSGRFGKWLENLVDWNLSRSRYWGTPLPIWRTEDGSQELCIGSVEQLFSEIEKSVKAGLMKKNPFEGFIPGDYSKENYEKIDLHRPYVDEIILVSDEGKAMYREPDLIDVWFDSGAMPYAQMHYPFESKDNLPFPADFIAEGVDQTRGWFFTLHALATLLFDSVAFKNIISNGLVLDKNGNKMSKRLGNAVDPFAVIEQYGSDPLRWYMMTNSQPWDNLKFDISGVDEVKRKFFGTLYNTYSFFSLYANVDGFVQGAEEVPVAERPEIDRWIISVLNSLVKEVENAYSSYEPTRAGRALQDFVIENLSNWYVRLNRKRFWAGEYNKDKIAAYQTLYTCLKTVAVLSAPIAPFFMEKLYLDLTGENKSVHLAMMPECNEALIDLGLEERMSYAQQISSMVLALRRKVSIKVRQPLQKIMIPDMGVSFREQIDKIKDLVLSEVNVKELEYLADDSGVLVKKIKPNFKTLGPKHGKLMKGIAAVVNTLTPAEITHFEREGRFEVEVEGSKIELLAEDVEIISEDIPGWLVANEGKLTVALDITITEELRQEGLARELVNRIQNIRKDSGFEITDKIELYIRKHEAINNAVMNFTGYIGTQTLAPKISLVDECNDSAAIVVELDSDIETAILVKKISN
jgi:isoleucyl-tRNA synthetase